jgi:hypothetical protein
MKKRKVQLIVVVAILIICWIFIDLYRPVRAHLRRFDVAEVARLDTEMWRSYYSRKRLKLFLQLGKLLRSQYNLPLLRSNLVAYHAAKAAFIFKDGKNRSDYEKALPDLISFYTAIRKVSDIEFDVARAARLELEWWIIHRERAVHSPGRLESALADLAAEIYQVPAVRLFEHGRFRAEAMKIRDTKAEAGGVSEEDWSQIHRLLLASWQSLKTEVDKSQH